MEKKRTLLTIVSILFLIFGVFSVITAILGVIGGGILAIAVDTTAGILTIIGVVIACAKGILQFMAGVKGIKKKKLYECRNLGITLLVLAVLGFALSGFDLSWDHIVAILLPVLYLIGLR